MYPVPTLADLSTYSGRAQSSYTSYGDEALTQATIRFSFLTEVWATTDIPLAGGMTQADAEELITKAICALADHIYLQQPYQATIASPLQSETIGSYSFNKSMGQAGGGSMSRMAPGAMELNMETTGIVLFDLAVQMFAKRTLAGGVFADAVTVFEDDLLYYQDNTGRRFVLGPQDKDQIDVPWDINGEVFPQDPGVG